ncbi:hypothetical protein [Streptomyces sp. t39]|uniref:hypothetical protein n=1 Tax=Streptomyces sp. t39 TaxID=1828156 RepID=UPI0011CE7CD0|nr:hypothetical protein [Streptomyces sp. t39]TXS52910.1 hypothetical protein EAO77_18990 [Streptomyces sp. t39]
MTAALVSLAAVLSLTACEDGDAASGAGRAPVGLPAVESPGAQGAGAAEDGADGESAGRNGGGTGGAEGPDGLTTRERFMLDNLPEAGSVMAAGEYVQRFTTCEQYSIDPSDTRYYAMDEKFDESWGVRFRGVCDEGGGSRLRVFFTGTGEGMKAFQKAYHADIADRLGADPDAGIDGGFAVGRDFAVIAVDPGVLRRLSASHLLVLNCNPAFEARGDVRTAPALVDGCVLTDDFLF